MKAAKESLVNGGGDCDDASVLVASLLESIGVKTRFVFVTNHVYVQAYLPDALSRYKADDDWVNLDAVCSNCKFGEISQSTFEKEKSYVSSE